MIFLFLILSLFQVGPQENFVSQANSVFDTKNFITESDLNYLNLQDLSADVILVKEINGKTLFNHNIEKQKEIASLTKLMSTYLGYTIYSRNKIFTFTSEAVAQDGHVGAFYVGEKISRDDILKASLVASSNDAIYLLAQTYGLNNFVSLMNEKAKEWRMFKTNFTDPTGLDKNISTAYDLYLMLTKIYSRIPELFNFTRLSQITINNKILWTTNLLLDRYQSIIVGAKTGYKESAGENLAMILKFNNSPFLSVIILDSKDRWQDAENIINALKKYYGK